MMRIGIEVNGVLRDTIGKFTQLYEKHMIDQDPETYVGATYTLDISGNTELIDQIDESFKYEIKSDVTSLKLKDHFAFRSDDELFSFTYEEYAMELFGHAPSTETFTFNILNDFYYDFRNDNDLIIVSDEIGKSKPSTLFFLSKFGCLFEKVFFYSETTKDSMWDSVDILLTSNPDLLLNVPNGKVVIKYTTEYNKHVSSEYEISTLSELSETIKTIKNYV
jgi:hypothetical protein